MAEFTFNRSNSGNGDDEPVTRAEFVAFGRELVAAIERRDAERDRVEDELERLRQHVAYDDSPRGNGERERDPEAELARIAAKAGLTADQFAEAIEKTKRAQIREAVRECLPECLAELVEELPEDEDERRGGKRPNGVGKNSAGKNVLRRRLPDDEPPQGPVPWSERYVFGGPK